MYNVSVNRFGKLILLSLATIIGMFFLFFYPEINGYFENTKEKTKYDNNITQIFSDSFYDSFEHHNQILDFYEKLQEDGKIGSTNKILINIDWHSDAINTNEHITQGTEDIYNWVNSMISENDMGGVIDEYYWVLPEASIDNVRIYKFWNTPPDKKYFGFGLSDQTFYIDNETGEWYLEKPEGKDIREISFHRRVLSQIESFQNTNKEIVLTIDADYFISNGHEVDGSYLYQGSEEELEKQLSKFTQRINDLGIKPFVIACSYSEGYIQENYRPIMESYFDKIGTASINKGEYLDVYTRTKIK